MEPIDTKVERVDDHVGRPLPRGTWTIGAILLVLLAWAIGWQIMLVAQQHNRTIPEMLAHFENSGLQFGEPEKLPRNEALADAVRVSVAGRELRFYHFADTTLTDRGNVDVETAKRTLKVSEDELAANGPFVMLGHRNHPRSAEVLESFRGFGTP